MCYFHVLLPSNSPWGAARAIHCSPGFFLHDGLNVIIIILVCIVNSVSYTFFFVCVRNASSYPIYPLG